jgi:hypothetical protein
VKPAASPKAHASVADHADDAAKAAGEAAGDKHLAARVAGKKTMNDKLYALAGVDTSVFDPIINTPGMTAKYDLHNEYLRQLSSKYNEYERGKDDPFYGRNFVKGADTTINATRKAVESLRRAAADGAKFVNPVTQQPIDLAAAADFYERHALPLMQAVRDEVAGGART